MTRLALGTVQFGLKYGISNKHGQTEVDDVERILERAQISGIDCLDTAYGYGDSESRLGQFDLSKFHIVSKFPDPNDTPIRHFVEASLDRLGVSGLYGYLAHSSGLLLDRSDRCEQLLDLRDEGLVQKVGCSLYSPDELDTLLSQGAPLDLVQVPYNILDRRFEPYFTQIKSLGIEIHTRSAFLQGLLFMEPAELSPFFSSALPVLQDLREQFPAAEERAAQLLNFCLGEKRIDRVVFGVNSPRQFENNLDHLRSLGSFPHFEPPVIPQTILDPRSWPQVNLSAK